MYGVRQFNAIINPPESAILAVGAIRETLRLTPTGIVAVPIMTLTLSSDHRVVDGMLAAQFLAALREKLESGLENATDDDTTTGKPEWITERSLP
jgi:pyruvate dehydrogenase E2 component (dihydrolipoamide acetyltransferase)